MDHFQFEDDAQKLAEIDYNFIDTYKEEDQYDDQEDYQKISIRKWKQAVVNKLTVAHIRRNVAKIEKEEEIKINTDPKSDIRSDIGPLEIPIWGQPQSRSMGGPFSSLLQCPSPKPISKCGLKINDKYESTEKTSSKPTTLRESVKLRCQYRFYTNNDAKGYINKHLPPISYISTRFRLRKWKKAKTNHVLPQPTPHTSSTLHKLSSPVYLFDAFYLFLQKLKEKNPTMSNKEIARWVVRMSGNVEIMNRWDGDGFKGPRIGVEEDLLQNVERWYGGGNAQKLMGRWVWGDEEDEWLMKTGDELRIRFLGVIGADDGLVE
jgi:hypothetical protein